MTTVLLGLWQKDRLMSKDIVRRENVELVSNT